MTLKFCNKCKTDKPETMFPFRNPELKKSRYRTCESCLSGSNMPEQYRINRDTTSGECFCNQCKTYKKPEEFYMRRSGKTRYKTCMSCMEKNMDKDAGRYDSGHHGQISRASL
jgi:hypothetical protein